MKFTVITVVQYSQLVSVVFCSYHPFFFLQLVAFNQTALRYHLRNASLSNFPQITTGPLRVEDVVAEVPRRSAKNIFPGAFHRDYPHEVTGFQPSKRAAHSALIASFLLPRSRKCRGKPFPQLLPID